MRKIYFLLFSLSLAFSLQARERTAGEMKQIALSQLGLSAATRSQSADEVKQMYAADMLTIYGNDKAFVVVSKDTQFTPVLGYSDAPFDAEHLPTDFCWWMAQISASMRRGYQSDYVPSTRATGDGTYLVKALWGQESPYSDACPAVTGCVATAMAQIMYYYGYPAIGTGTNCTYTYEGTTETRSFNTTYEWDKMVDDYYNSTVFLSKARKQAVANLMFDAGTAVHMQYSNSGSGAYTYDAATAFVKNFSYDSLSVNMLNRFLYSDTEWMDIISKEITSGRPILYTGADSVAGGHAFIFDGLDGNGRVHINWGWNGSANGFYSIADLSPGDTILASNLKYHFNVGQQMVIGLKNHAEADAEDSYHSQWCSDSTIVYSSAAKDSLTLELANLYNMDYQTFSGKILLLLINQTSNDTTAVDLLDVNDHTTGTVGYGYGMSLRGKDGKVKLQKFSLKDDLGLKAGTYKVCLASQSDKQTVPTLFRVSGGESSAVFAYGADGTVTFNPTTGISSVRVNKPQPSDGTVRVYDASGRLVLTTTVSAYRSDDIPGHGLFIIRQGEKTQKVVK